MNSSFSLYLNTSDTFTLVSMMMLVTLFLLQGIFVTQGLINLDWATLEREVTIRYFSPDIYTPSQVSNMPLMADYFCHFS